MFKVGDCGTNHAWSSVSTEGESDHGITVSTINMADQSIRFINHGVTQELFLQPYKDSAIAVAKARAATGVGMPRTPVPGDIVDQNVPPGQEKQSMPSLRSLPATQRMSVLRQIANAVASDITGGSVNGGVAIANLTPPPPSNGHRLEWEK
jgi:hypothetical protein